MEVVVTWTFRSSPPSSICINFFRVSLCSETHSLVENSINFVIMRVPNIVEKLNQLWIKGMCCCPGDSRNIHIQTFRLFIELLLLVVAFSLTSCCDKFTERVMIEPCSSALGLSGSTHLLSAHVSPTKPTRQMQRNLPPSFTQHRWYNGWVCNGLRLQKNIGKPW